MNVEDANELIAASAKGEVVGSLASYEMEEEVEEVYTTFGNVVGQESLTRFDEAKRKKRRKGKRRPKGGSSAALQGGAKSSSGDAKSSSVDAKSSGRRPSRNRGRGRNKGSGGASKPQTS